MSIYSDFADRLPKLSDREGTTSAQLMLVEDAGRDEPVLSITYRCDYRYEEEAGAADLSTAFLRAGTKRNFMTAEYLRSDESLGRSKMKQADLLVETDTLVGFAVAPVSSGPAKSEMIEKTLSHKSGVLHSDYKFYSKYFRKSVSQLKAEAKARGHKGYSALRHGQLVDLLSADDSKPEGPVIVEPGEFSTGKILWFAKTDSLFTEVLLRLVDAAKAGQLVVTAGGVFGSGINLLDARDVSDETVEAIRESNAWTRKQMKKLAPVAEVVKSGPMANPYSGGFYFLGSPRFDSERADVVYFLNGNSVRFANGRSVQPHGWYTLDDLRNERYMQSAAVDADDSFRSFDDKGSFRAKKLTEDEAATELKRRGLISAVDDLKNRGYSF